MSTKKTGIKENGLFLSLKVCGQAEEEENKDDMTNKEETNQERL